MHSISPYVNDIVTVLKGRNQRALQEWYISFKYTRISMTFPVFLQ